MKFELQSLLGDLERTLSEPERMLRAASVSLAEEMIDLIKQGFRDERDPYGDPWKPKKVPDGRKILSGPTGRLKAGWQRIRADENGFEVAAPSVSYAPYHQRGTARMARRMMVPDDVLGLPPAWERAFEETANDVLAGFFR